MHPYALHSPLWRELVNALLPECKFFQWVIMEMLCLETDPDSCFESGFYVSTTSSATGIWSITSF